MKFRTGYLPTPAGHFRTPFHHLSARLNVGELPAEVSLFDKAPPVMDQGQTGSCTGHGSSCGLYVAAGLSWVPSPAEIYRNGRAISRAPGQALTDNGADPAQVFAAINEFGVRPMTPLTDRYSDADPATINDEPKLGDLEAEALTVLVGDYGITSTGAQRVRDFQTSLAAGIPVTVAIAGGCDAFQNYSGGILPALNAPLDHYVCLLAYKTLPDGSIAFGGQNSWGPFWGEAGRFWLSDPAVQELGDNVSLTVRRAS